MPAFRTISIAEARANTATGQRAALLHEYMGYVQRVPPKEAGVLEAVEGETTQAIRRRLGAAAEALGKELVVRRAGDTVYFWASPGPRRGRSRKQSGA